HRIVIDPVDGSNNVIRGISTAGLALAVLPIDAPVLPEHVQYALVGDLYSGTVYTARKSHGARRNGQRCEVSQVHHIQHCLAGLNLDGRNQAVIRTLLTEQPVLSHVRRCGSSAMDSVYVASGSYDAYIDVGDTLTGESFLASGCIVLEAGGIISDHQGKPLRPITSLRDGYSIVIASTHELHQEIIDRITRCL
ncbi:MAG: hypothetical protein J2P37_22705, partial [Ktedonobacteraceae bacterium]|nr:hypothetical protein [Ktedonobacteraceae bacterium]